MSLKSNLKIVSLVVAFGSTSVAALADKLADENIIKHTASAQASHGTHIETLGNWRVSAGVFVSLGAPSTSNAGAGLSMAVDYDFGGAKNGNWLGTFRYSRYEVSTGTDRKSVV